MSFKRGEKNGIETFTLINKNGAEAELVAPGASIRSLKVPDKNGELRDVVLGYENAADYLLPGPCHGAVCGRVANRIEDATFALGDKEYKLPPNYQGRHVLHGGDDTPLSRRVFTYKNSTENSVTLSAYLPDGENGFPGNMTVDVTYTLSDDNALRIDYRASCDADTVINLTNHAYFNLKGHGEGDICDHLLKIYADTYAPLAENGMVYGAVEPVPEEFDFREGKPIGRDIEKNHPQLRLGGGYDHAWTVRKKAGELSLCAESYSAESGIFMSVRTSSPTVLLYTGNNLSGDEHPPKDDKKYIRRGAFCLETGFYPNCLKFPSFNQGRLYAGEEFKAATEYAFSVR